MSYEDMSDDELEVFADWLGEQDATGDFGADGANIDEYHEVRAELERRAGAVQEITPAEPQR